MDINEISKKELEEDFKVLEGLVAKYDAAFSIDDYKARSLTYLLGLFNMNLNSAKVHLAEAIRKKQEGEINA